MALVNRMMINMDTGYAINPIVFDDTQPIPDTFAGYLIRPYPPEVVVGWKYDMVNEQWITPPSEVCNPNWPYECYPYYPPEE